MIFFFLLSVYLHGHLAVPSGLGFSGNKGGSRTRARWVGVLL